MLCHAYVSGLGALHVRPLRADDRAALLAGFERLSDASRMRRFHGAKPSLSPRELRYLTEIDHQRHEALVALAEDGAIVGVARYAAIAGRPGAAELAVVIADDWQGRGVASMLCGALLERAAGNGILEMVATTTPDNGPAKRLTGRLGFTTHAVGPDGVEARRDLVPSRARRLFDAHLHIIDPAFPLMANAGYVPPAFTAADYEHRVAGLGVRGGAVVSGSFQGFDQDHLVAALRRLGPGFVGVTQLPATVSDEQILALDTAGVRAVRFNVRRGGSAGLADLDRLARRVHELAGWHAELYIDARDLAAIAPTVAALPAVSVDHLGLSREGVPGLVGLAERGVRVKATGFGRVDLPLVGTLRAIHAANPTALMFGTDLPSTRARRPFSDADVDLIAETLGDEGARAVLHDNAAAFYAR